jgi:hypothetical protein
LDRPAGVVATSTVRYIREYLMRRKSPAPDFHALDAEADQALDAARRLPHGRERTEALKKAGLLRNAADARGVLLPKRGRPAKG